MPSRVVSGSPLWDWPCIPNWLSPAIAFRTTGTAGDNDDSFNVRGPIRAGRPMAEPGAGRLEGHLRDIAHVDANRRKDPARPDALGQSFVACHVPGHLARRDDVAHPLRGTHVPDRLRLQRPPAAGPDQRRRAADDGSSAT